MKPDLIRDLLSLINHHKYCVSILIIDSLGLEDQAATSLTTRLRLLPLGL